ncbi:hypothetical protein HDIA_0719 [Hartmannibacter diazotrophicus]|uniref:Uncharacterized protein n=1 Tax=Hartmannibacter diazotrophicus TaxID=1482074 RepID=A0A2C9D1Y8_9HYPH|nr:hypothetical protein [Hartmannibacter diazotrophicus]SON54260.1 hypothetical protein HDIA_0719 [Hartmannibacter diazotrophicus]
MGKNFYANQRKREARERREAEYLEEMQARQKRIDDVHMVPEHSAEAYVRLEDTVGSDQAMVIANFVTSMLENELERITVVNDASAQ